MHMTEQVFLYLPGRKKERMHRFCKSSPASLEEVCLSAFILGVALGFFPPHSAWFGHSRHVFVNTQCFLPDWTLPALNPTPRTLLLNSSLSPPLSLSVCLSFFPVHIYFQGCRCACPYPVVCIVWWCLSPHRSLFCDRLNYDHYIFCLKVISNTLLLLLFILFLNSVCTVLPDILNCFCRKSKSIAYNWFPVLLVNKVLDKILQGRNLAPLAKHKSNIKESSWVHM